MPSNPMVECFSVGSKQVRRETGPASPLRGGETVPKGRGNGTYFREVCKFISSLHFFQHPDTVNN